MNKSPLVFAMLALLPFAGYTQGRDASNPAGPWFGVKIPAPFGVGPAVLIGERTPRPVTLPNDEKQHPELVGATISKDVEAIVAFSKQSLSSRELGGDQLWGRVSGFPSSDKTVEWSAAQLRLAGIADVRVQPLKQDPKSSLWLPEKWEVRLLGDPAFGAGTHDLILESAIPLPPADLANGTLTAPLVYVGNAGTALIDHIDVKGKIAVQLTIPQGHMVFERGVVVPRAQALMKRGAVAVLNLVRLPGNERSRDFSNCGGPCFNLGGRDGWFLEQVLERAAETGLSGKVRARLTLKTRTHTGLSAKNAVAVIPGKSSETIVIDGHADAWFEGAGDNADGLAVMLALARHFALKENQLERTLAFIVSAGHHTPGLNGPRAFVQANPELAKRAVLVINIEHVAQRNFVQARSVGPDGFREAVADLGEAPVVIGITNGSAALEAAIDKSLPRYGTNVVAARSTMQSGETGGFADIAASKMTLMQSPPLYHTTGEISEVISTPGLERMARFLAYFLKEVDQQTAAQINSPAQR